MYLVTEGYLNCQLDKCKSLYYLKQVFPQTKVALPILAIPILPHERTVTITVFHYKNPSDNKCFSHFFFNYTCSLRLTTAKCLIN